MNQESRRIDDEPPWVTLLQLDPKLKPIGSPE
jgi:hypothetical protein